MKHEVRFCSNCAQPLEWLSMEEDSGPKSRLRCAACGHADAYALKTKIVYECVACGKQHSLLAGTIFEQTKTG